MSALRLSLEHPALARLTGLGVRVAVVDSGIAAGHPHIGPVAGGIRIAGDGTVDADFADRIGHGTAVAAAIREKAPEAELFAIRVFETRLTATAEALADGIRRAMEHRARLVNLSLGTANPAHGTLLAEAVGRARIAGALVVSALELDGTPSLPGSLDGVLGVRLDWACPRDEIRLEREGGSRVVAVASGYPRPVPGVPPERNLKGMSFAVANVTGLVARLFSGSDRRVATGADVGDLAREALSAGR